MRHRHGPARAHLLASAILVVALILTGCGGSDGNGGGSGSEIEDFAETLNGYCPQFVQLADLADALQDSSDLQAAANATREYARTGEELADALDELSPPEDAEAAWNQFVDAVRESARAQGAVIEALESGNLERFTALEGDISRAQSGFVTALNNLDGAGVAFECGSSE